MEFRVIERPEKVDVPQPHTRTSRRVNLPDGTHWVDIIGGYSHEERRFASWWWDESNKVAEIGDAAEREQAENTINAHLASFFDAHIVGHNLTYPGTKEPLPENGFDLFWELPVRDIFGLFNRMVQPVSFFEDPKAEATSSTG